MQFRMLRIIISLSIIFNLFILHLPGREINSINSVNLDFYTPGNMPIIPRTTLENIKRKLISRHYIKNVRILGYPGKKLRLRFDQFKLKALGLESNSVFKQLKKIYNQRFILKRENHSVEIRSRDSGESFKRESERLSNIAFINKDNFHIPLRQFTHIQVLTDREYKQKKTGNTQVFTLRIRYLSGFKMELEKFVENLKKQMNIKIIYSLQ